MCNSSLSSKAHNDSDAIKKGVNFIKQTQFRVTTNFNGSYFRENQPEKEFAKQLLGPDLFPLQ